MEKPTRSALTAPKALTFKRIRLSAWTAAVMVIAVLVSTPVLFVLSNIFADAGEIWRHLAETVLWRYIANSFWLMLGVGFGVAVIGVGTAWLVTMCRFPGSRLFEWALLLPLAAPAYVLAYTYTDFLDFSGPVQTTLRNLFGWSYGDYWFPNIRSLWGAIAMLTLVLYPYVYLLVRVAFLEQSVCTLEASRSLGCSPWRSFFAVALPLARPAIAAGMALALMETLNDFGTVKYFGVDTFTTGIYRTWFGLGNRVAAAQLAAFLLLFILWLILLERWSRRRAQYYQSTNRYGSRFSYPLKGMRAFGAGLACLLPLSFGFLLPAAILLEMTLKNATTIIDKEFWAYARHSFILAVITAGLGVAIAIIMAYGLRLRSNPLMRFATRIASMGYAVPGSVIAVGILIPIGRLDNAIDAWMRATFGISTGLLLSGTITALVFAYLVRFLAVSFNTVEASLSKIKPSLDDAARSLGHNPTSTLVKVHTPMMWGGLLTAGMLLFVDVMKELSATLIIRPFNFDTLAVRVYNLASDERLAEAAGPALAIVVVGIVPVILLSLRIREQGVGNGE
ncbi:MULTISPECIES: ABC transporter permease [unclassified Coleofasciculus]|uniref:ABC transporter permease n=1 Tax=unclassified Coleofasciculus TaxID=2692782 RepID=UPI001880F97F|nr:MULTISPECIES: iron ABC transporter permease [unclassified Coleofasciculus]MBE9124827.1 iron ABC transporter permease [Coleofasciculus sp. LEGE 07081]MBE9147732.1 iron ABC transporter permease [Coleofasciculus sp. LEGE 07092]